ncbi:IMP 5'-nucleotidase [Saccharomycopsis crataegensis]|uniref:IMP-specific 5'-nucleotidase 1 n=1 Tax=Saccharomycopsis crataegensis TaxID=43959 RepID=A0AAV5QJK0_9ASCO|nr:IMP 5'-nucleotidase [Saccharomycopsis crataegensis]
MSSRYRVEYALKSHRRDAFIEWIKTLLAVPFVLHAVHGSTITGEESGKESRKRYAEIFSDIERLINDDIQAQKDGKLELSRLRQLVPELGLMFTPLPLEEAFYIEDKRRSISERRYVSPSFNDVRSILVTAQVLELAKSGLKLVTFDGDVTLYDDGECIAADSPLIGKLIGLLENNIHVGIVTAAGYSEKSGKKYYIRLKGLIDAVRETERLTVAQKEMLYIMGGESNFLFKYDTESQRLKYIRHEDWLLPEMQSWTAEDMEKVLDISEQCLSDLSEKLQLSAEIIRKERAIGIVAKSGSKLIREQLEEIVLSVQKKLENDEVAQRLKFCAFNGGSDVWVDVGDKSLGVNSLQRFLGGIKPQETLHVGDQFLSVGANDFKARLVSCTAWIASPSETEQCISDLLEWI